ncbi:MAG: alcohol dehydrogenase catalytic domain-containing protein [Vampirovibrionales bacterium]|nr:alcohol dehydrogenase catalytic domain-containing protein [Vampirovibrionales bacterium]
MLAATVQNNGSLALSQVQNPVLPRGGALLRVIGCGLCGSDLDKWRHRKAPPGAVLGHEVVGRIEALCPEATSDFRVGDRVACAHHTPCGACHDCRNGAESMCAQFKRSNLIPGGFSQRLALSADHLRLTTFAVPDAIGDAEASCVEPMACVLRAVRRGGEAYQGRVAIIGLGFIGLMAAQVYKMRGYWVEGYDRQADRVALGLSRGWLDAGVTVDADAPLIPPAEAPVDRVFLSVVTPQTLSLSLQRARDGGALILFASPHHAGPTLDPGLLYFRELSVIPSYSPAVEDLREAAALIFNGQIDVSPLCTHSFPMSAIDEALARYQRGEAIKIFLTPPPPETPEPPAEARI